jgi:rieske iron-sulfur protein
MTNGSTHHPSASSKRGNVTGIGPTASGDPSRAAPPDSRMALPGRRAVLKGALGLGLCAPFLDVLSARANDPKTTRPQVGDLFVVPFGEKEGQVIKPEDLPVGGPSQLAYPMDPQAKVVRDGSFFNQVVLVRLDPAQLTDETRQLGADGVVAFSVVCTHQGCPVSMWKAETKNLFCSCHGSQFDPRDRGKAVDGPATRRLPMLPVKMVDGGLTVAGAFTGRLGATTP